MTRVERSSTSSTSFQRLTSVNCGDDGTHRYSFDPVENRFNRADNVNDAAGNTLSGGGRTNTWDSQNRLTQCANGANSCSYVYGADGYRHRSVVNGVTTDFAIDGDNVVREIRAGVNQATYLGSLYRRDDIANAVRWYIQDGLGSVLAEVDPNGSVTGTRKLDVYGINRGTTGTLTSKHAYVGTLGHTSEPETGLIYMRARYYDPQVGRFSSEDRGKHVANWYVYCANNPVNAVDVDGKSLTPSQRFFLLCALILGIIALLLTGIMAIDVIGAAGVGAAVLGLIVTIGGMDATLVLGELALTLTSLQVIGCLSALVPGLLALFCGYLAAFDDPVGLNADLGGTSDNRDNSQKE